jgi:hypothetical protein
MPNWSIKPKLCHETKTKVARKILKQDERKRERRERFTFNKFLAIATQDYETERANFDNMSTTRFICYYDNIKLSTVGHLLGILD